MKQNTTDSPRSVRARIAAQTLAIIAEAGYHLEGKGEISIAEDLALCLAGTQLYRPEDFASLETRVATALGTRAQSKPTSLPIYAETTFATCRRWVLGEQRKHVACLNFASAKNPGGGFLGGSQAQEEALSRASALYASLQTQPAYYEFNRHFGTCLYSDHMIWSPQVPVFRDDQDMLLAQPYAVSIITAPAVNAGALRQNEPAKIPQIVPEMKARAHKVLALAVDQRVEHLVLGAWGCGVFANDPQTVAEIFFDLLQPRGAFGHAFEEVAFSIPGAGASSENFKAFEAVLADA